MTDDLDRVLERLGTVAAPAGLEERVLRRMDRHRVSRGVGWRWALVAAMLLLGVAGWTAREVELGHRSAVGLAETHAPGSMHGAHASVVNPDSRPVGIHVAKAKPFGRLRGTPAASAKAEEGGFPAPELPLTEQERLLLKLARRPNEGTLAMFDLGIREERAAEEKAEFEFFNPARPFVEQPMGSTFTQDNRIQEKNDDGSASKR